MNSAKKFVQSQHEQHEEHDLCSYCSLLKLVMIKWIAEKLIAPKRKNIESTEFGN